MAKRRKKAKRPVEPEEDLEEEDETEAEDLDADEEEDVEDDDEEDEEDESDASVNTKEKTKDFFGSIGDSLKAAGKAAEKYTRIGLSHATLEKLHLELKLAYSRLGEAVNKCWDAAPDIGVAPDDPAVKAQVKAVNDLRRKIRETEIKLRTLKH